VIRLSAGPARLAIDPAAGGRIVSLELDGRSLLVGAGPSPFEGGSFPMAPFAGRIRRGSFAFRGQTYQLPINFPPHAIHGFTHDRPWTVESDGSISCELGAPWPFRGRVSQTFDLAADRLDVRIELEADEPMPATIGWHPWFRRRVEPGVDADGAAGDRVEPLQLEVEPGARYQRDGEGIPTGELVEPGPRPWDDCFVRLRRPPVLDWPGFARLTIESSCDHWVIYDEPADAICVEPQTGPPDGLNLDPRVVEPGDPLVATMTWRWELARPSGPVVPSG
jgi:aldose 1-epimerase